MKQICKPARGAERLFAPERMPVFDPNAAVKYEGSISKCGDNADWDWGMYEDERGEWVLMEADGAGCIYNFTQHRYPTSKVPTFRFYFDGSDTPALTCIPADFGETEQLPAPYAGKFVGPEEGGRGPIWVVRSFVPMEFRTHCKVTASFRLEGCDKARGEGGWGHVMYQQYDSPDGLTTYHGAFDPTALTRVWQSFRGESLRPDCAPLQPGGSLRLPEITGPGSVHGLFLSVEDFRPECLSDLWVSIRFDRAAEPQVLAPVGTLFGCEYGKTPACLNTLLLEQDTTGKTAFFRCSCPMPYFTAAEITVENRGVSAVSCGIAARADDALRYDPASTGYFCSAPYAVPTENRPGENAKIADISGAGQVVYAVLTGCGIASAGCEGDVRVFADGASSPTVESDGSESWASYGWGFVDPPQSNPFSAYNGLYGENSDWSELRLTFGDSYTFRRRLRFELEHGEMNNGGGKISGQVFYYAAPDGFRAVDCGCFTPADGLRYTGEVETLRDRFEDGVHERYEMFDCVRGETSFTLTVPADCRGLLLQRVCTQRDGRMEAEVLVDGVRVTERNWLFPDQNTIYTLLEDDFFVPARYLAGKTSVTVTLRPLDESWNVCRIKAIAY